MFATNAKMISTAAIAKVSADANDIVLEALPLMFFRFVLAV